MHDSVTLENIVHIFSNVHTFHHSISKNHSFNKLLKGLLNKLHPLHHYLVMPNSTFLSTNHPVHGIGMIVCWGIFPLGYHDVEADTHLSVFLLIW